MYRILKFVWFLSNFIPLLRQKTVFWIPVMRSGSNFVNNLEGGGDNYPAAEWPTIFESQGTPDRLYTLLHKRGLKVT